MNKLISLIFISSIVIIRSDESICLPTSVCGNEKTLCSANGYCFYNVNSVITDKGNFTDIHCICNKGYSSLSGETIKCCYSKKSQFIAFLLETLVGFGAGHFYIGNNSVAIIKLISITSLVCSCCIISICLCYKTEKVIETPQLKYKILNFIYISSILLWLGWQLFDMILFGLNVYTDGNQQELDKW